MTNAPPVRHCTSSLLRTPLIGRKPGPPCAQWVAVEMGGEPLSTFDHPERCVYILGAEDAGLPEPVLRACRHRISLEGVRAESYNVAVAGTLIMYDRLNKKAASARKPVVDGRAPRSAAPACTLAPTVAPPATVPVAGADGGALHARLCSLRGEPDGGGAYLEKDLLKAVGASSLLGAGGTGSSTERYVIAAGDLANVGSYAREDRVFVSANGDRPGRHPVLDEHGQLQGVYSLLQRAVSAGATIVADVQAYREDSYNVGERELASWLLRNGYCEQPPGSGVWVLDST